MEQRQAHRGRQQDHGFTPLIPGVFELRQHHPFPCPSSQAMKKFLTTAPVFAAIWFTITAGIMIEFNRFYPDLLFHPL
jgi:photosystem I subunit 9